MIHPIPGWTWESRASGMLMLSPAGAIRYTERVRPLACPRDAVLSLIMPPDYVLGEISAPESFVTHEGEYGAIVGVGGTLAGVPVQRTIAMVFLDDFYALTVGIAYDPAYFEKVARTVAAAARGDVHMLGSRRRRFVYQPPAGWQGLAVGPYDARWLPDDYPRDGSSLAVYPALPGMSAEALVAVHAQVDEIAAPVAVASRTRLSGRWWQATARDGSEHDFVVFEDDRYIYPLVMRSPPERYTANREVLRRVLESVEAIPRGAGLHMSVVSTQWED